MPDVEIANDDAVETVWAPHDGPQTFFAGSPIKDVCYGGARAGAKTTGLLFCVSKREAKYGNKIQAVIFRKSYPELAEVIRKGQKYLKGQLGWKYVGGDVRTFTAPSGATLMLRYARNIEDAKLYDGFEWTDIYFDEIGNWPTSEVCDYLLGCLRSGDGIPCVRRSTCMPGGPGHVWVKERYKPDEPWTVRLLTPFPKERPDLTMESYFIPAKLEDNPSIDAAQYEANMASAGNDALFEAWRYGRWDLIQGAFFSRWDEETMTVDDPVVRDWDVRWLSADWGWTDDCVVHWHAQDENRRVVTYREVKVNKTTPQDLGKLIVKLNAGEKLAMFAFSPDAFAQRTSPRTIAEEVSKELVAAGLTPATRADDDREGGWMLMNQLLVSGMWKISTECKELIRAIPLLQHHPKNSADIDDSPFDHAPDSARYGLKTFLRETRVPREEIVRRYVVQHLAPMTGADADKLLDEEIPVPTDPKAAEAHWNRVARLSEMAERHAPKRHIRPRPRRYARGA